MLDKILEESPTEKRYRFTMKDKSTWFKSKKYEVFMLSREPIPKEDLSKISNLLLKNKANWQEKPDKKYHYHAILTEYPSTNFYITKI